MVRRQGEKEWEQVNICLQILEEHGFPMTEREIAQVIQERNLFPKKGLNIQRTVNLRLSDYYNSRGLEPENRIPIVIKRIVPAVWAHKKGKHPELKQLLERCKQLQSESNYNLLRETLTELFDVVRIWLAKPPNQKHEKRRAAEEFKEIVLTSILAAGSGNQEAQRFITRSHVTTDKSEHKRLSIVFVGNNGVGKSHLINMLIMIYSPRVLRGKTGYYWTNLELTLEQRNRFLNIAIDTINTELSELGVSANEQRRLIREATNGGFDNPNRRLPFDKSDEAVLEEAERIEALLRRRSNRAAPDYQEMELFWDNPFLLPSGLSSTSSTTTYAYEIIYGALPAAITVFKTPAELAKEAEIELKYPEEFQKAMELCTARQYLLVIGQGRNLTLDRVHVAKALYRQQEDPVLSIATKKKIIFFPIQPLINGGMWVDSPGCDDTNPIVKASLPKICANANNIFVVMKRNVQHNEAAQALLQASGIFDRMVEDPLNYDVHFVENAEMDGRRPCSSVDLEAFHARNPTDSCLIEAKAFVAAQLEEASKRVAALGKTVYDRNGDLHNVRIFPMLFAARALENWDMKKATKNTASDLETVNCMELSGGYDLLGSMHKMFYGYQQMLIGHLFERLEHIDLPSGLRTQTKDIVKKLKEQHIALNALTVEGKASRVIGSALVNAEHGGLFPSVAEMEDHVCIFDCLQATTPEVAGKSINCDYCKMWYHADCLGLSADQYAAYAKRGQPFYCHEPECQAFAKQLQQSESQLSNQSSKRKATTVHHPKRLRR